MADNKCYDSVLRSSFSSTSLHPCSKQLSPEWKAVSTEDQRIYFYNLRTRSTHWFPPPEFWVSKLGLPYGWEAALDSNNIRYYINHVTRITTPEDPRSEADQDTDVVHMATSKTLPQARRIELVRDAAIGFGFVAGSEKPVVIRSVIPEGPSYEKLFANDQILRVNGEDVQDALQKDVIKLIKSATGCIELEVVASEDVQDTKNQHHRKSSLMSRTTRERRRSTPVSVRFAAESALVQVIGPTEAVRRSSLPLIPNVLKVFLENGQTRSFRYDSATTVQEIFNSFGPKLDVKLLEHYSLVLCGPKKGQISYIQNHEKVSEIFSNRNCSSVNCLCKLNISFVPKDHFELLKQDPNTFEYLYAQATNRVVDGFYGMDLRYDLAINLAALHIQQKALDAAGGKLGKVSVRHVEREFGGLGKFVPTDHLDSRREKDLRKTLEQQIKLNENLASPGEKHMNSLQCKIHYLNLASDIFSYGGRYFNVELSRRDAANQGFTKVEKQHVTLLVNLKYGVSHVVRGKVNVQCQLADFKEITGFSSCGLGDGKQFLRILLLEGKGIELICTSLDCSDLIALITGYYRLYVDNTSHQPLPVDSEEACPFGSPRNPPDVPEFHSKHRVVPDVWSYPSRFQVSNGKKKVLISNSNPSNGHVKYMVIDLSKAPPRFQESAIYEEPDDGNAGASRTVSTKKENQDIPSNTKEDTDSYILDSAADSSNQVAAEEEALLTATSSVLGDSHVDSDNVSSEHRLGDATVQKTEVSCDEQLSSFKRRQRSRANLATESWDPKSANTLAPESLQEDNEDSKSALSLREEIFEGKETRSEVEGESDCIDESDVTNGSDSSVFVDIALHPEANNINDDQTSLESMGYLSSSCSTLDQSEQMGKSLAIQPKQASDAFKSSSFGDSQITTAMTQNESLIGPVEMNFLSADDVKRPIPETASPQLPLPQLAIDDQFANTVPFWDAPSPSSPPADLGFDESSLNNKELILTDLIEVEAKNESQDLPTSSVERVGLDDTCCTPEVSGQSQWSVLEDRRLLSVQSEGVDDDLWIDSDKNRFSDVQDEESGTDSETAERKDSGEDSDGSEESDLSEQDESLWSTFPEFFQPTSRVVSTTHKQAELNLSDEACDSNNMPRQSRSDQSVVLVRHRILNPSVSEETLTKEDNDGKNEGDCEHSSGESDASDDLEFTYEVNSDLSVERLTASDQNDVGSIKKRINDCGYNDYEGCYKQGRGREKTWTNTSRVSSCSENNKERELSLVRFSSVAVKALEEGRDYQVVQPSSSEGSNSPSFAAISNQNSHEFTESSVDKCLGPSGNNAAVLMAGAMSVPFEEMQSLLQHRTYSPTDWIISAPPTSTAELSDCDIHVVSPPPCHSYTSEDEDFDREVTDLVVPPPPFSVSPVTTINTVSPPPTDLDESESLDSCEVRFLSMTGDYKLGQKKVVETKHDSQSTLKGEQSSASLQDKLGTSLIGKEAMSMQSTINRLKKDRLVTAKDNNFSAKPLRETCLLHNSSLRASGLRSIKKEPSVSDSLTVSSSNSTSVTRKTGYGSEEQKELPRSGTEVGRSFETTSKELQGTAAATTALLPVPTNFSAFVRRAERSPSAKKADLEQKPPILPKRSLPGVARSTRRMEETKLVASNHENCAGGDILVQSADYDTDRGRSIPHEEGRLRESLTFESSKFHTVPSDGRSFLVRTADRVYSKDMLLNDSSALSYERKEITRESLSLEEISVKLTDEDGGVSRSVGETRTSFPYCSSLSSNRLEYPPSASQTPSGHRVLREHSTRGRETQVQLLDCLSSMHTRNGVPYIEKGNTRDPLCENGLNVSRNGFILEECVESEARSKSGTRLASKAHSSVHIPTCSSASLFAPSTSSTAARSLKKKIPYVSTPYTSSSRHVNQNWKGASCKESTRTRVFPDQSASEESLMGILGAVRLSEDTKHIVDHSESSPTIPVTSKLGASNTPGAGSLNSSDEYATSPKRVMSSASHLRPKRDVGLKTCENVGITPDVLPESTNLPPHVNDQFDTGTNQNTSGRICTNTLLSSYGEVPVRDNFPVIYTHLSPPLTLSPLPPLPDCPPPPLPTSPPPDVLPKLDDVDFDFGELLLDLEPTPESMDSDTSSIDCLALEMDMLSITTDLNAEDSLQEFTSS